MPFVISRLAFALNPTINWKMDPVLFLMRCLCSFTIIWKAMHISYELGWVEAMHHACSDFLLWHSPQSWVDVLPLTRSGFLSWYSPCFEELVARTWWGWTPRFNSMPMAPKEEKRTKHACFELYLSFLRVEWEYTLSRRCKISVRVDCCKPLESRLILSGICHSFGWGNDSSGHMLWISLSRPSLNVTQLVIIYLTWTWLTPWTASNVQEVLEENWVIETVILLGSSASCFSDKLYFPCFDVRMFGSSVRLVGFPVGSFVGLLISSTNWIQWYTRTRFPVAELRFMKASPKFSKERLPKAPRTWKGLSLQFNPFRVNCCSIFFLNAVSVQFACVTLQRHGSDKLLECLTAACKAFSLANAKGMGTNDWVIRSLD